jgi:membrane protein DedA with SNARE-associated domain
VPTRVGPRREKNVLELADFWLPLTFLAAILGTGMGFPIPEELPIVAAGIWAGDADIVAKFGALRWLMLPACIVTVVMGDSILYFIGAKFGTKVLQTRVFKRMLPDAKREEIEKNFHVHGVKVLLFARLLPGIRSPIFIMAGILKLPLRRFILADGIYAVPGVSTLFFLAWWFGEQFKAVIEKFEEGVSSYLRPLLILIALGLVIGYMLYKFLRHPVSTGDPKEHPLVEHATHVPIIKQVTQMIDGKHTEAPHGTAPPAPPPPEPDALKKEENVPG